MLLRKKHCFNKHALNLFKDLFMSCLKVLVGLGTKDKLLVRNENCFSVKVRSERL